MTEELEWHPDISRKLLRGSPAQRWERLHGWLVAPTALVWCAVVALFVAFIFQADISFNLFFYLLLTGVILGGLTGIVYQLMVQPARLAELEYGYTTSSWVNDAIGEALESSPRLADGRPDPYGNNLVGGGLVFRSQSPGSPADSLAQVEYIDARSSRVVRLASEGRLDDQTLRERIRQVRRASVD